MSAKITKAVVLKQLIDRLRRDVNGGKVHVQRGALNWASWTWPYPVTIEVKGANRQWSDLFGDGQDAVDMLVLVRCCIQIPTGSDPQIDDDTLDRLEEEVDAVFNALPNCQFVDKDGQTGTLAISQRWEGTTELTDQIAMACGFTTTVTMTF